MSKIKVYRIVEVEKEVTSKKELKKFYDDVVACEKLLKPLVFLDDSIMKSGIKGWNKFAKRKLK